MTSYSRKMGRRCKKPKTVSEISFYNISKEERGPKALNKLS